MIFAIWSNGNNTTGAKGSAQGFAIIAFIQAEALGFAFALADTEAIKGCQPGALIRPVGFRDGEVERMPMRLDEEVTFEPANAVFTGVADLRGGPFFDLITLAS